jgi:hypothetical protein
MSIVSPDNARPMDALSETPSRAAASPARQRTGRPHGLSLVLAGTAAAVVGAWGGLVPYIGNSFGYSSNGTGSWVWNLQHGLLYLLPGALAFAAGVAIVATARTSRRRFVSPIAGLAALLSGAWFVLGPFVWPIYYNEAVFGPASPVRSFGNLAGYNLGTGLLLTILGTLALAWGTAPLRSTTQPARSN